jgi:hypothetical protein
MPSIIQPGTAMVVHLEIHIVAGTDIRLDIHTGTIIVITPDIPTAATITDSTPMDTIPIDIIHLCITLIHMMDPIVLTETLLKVGIITTRTWKPTTRDGMRKPMRRPAIHSAPMAAIIAARLARAGQRNAVLPIVRVGNKDR